MDHGSEAAQEVGAFASEVVGAIKERPYATRPSPTVWHFALGYFDDLAPNSSGLDRVANLAVDQRLR
jgi:hypothetical protein